MFKDIAPKPKAGTVRKARKLRRAMTLPEVLLWRELKLRPWGLKFRREHGSGDYVLDFYCSDARLAIEVDGIAHDMGDRPVRDERRDAWFAENGIRTLRIQATDVLRDLPAALEAIVQSARSRLPLHHPAAPGGPPPRDKLGED
jgi:very-short-patch-repair endonuclease